MNMRTGTGQPAGSAKACGLKLGLAAVLLSFPAIAVELEEAQDLLHGRWYAAEVIIFERLNSNEAGPEDLVRFDERFYPANIRAMAEPNPWSAAELDPFTRVCLEFPRLEVRLPNPPSPALAEDAGIQPQPAAPTADGDAPTSFVEEMPRREPPTIHPTLAPHPLLDLLSAAAGAERLLQQNSYRWLDASALQLQAEAGRIRRAPNLQLIWHGRWMQPTPARDAGEPLLLQMGPLSGKVHSLEGTLQITLGRYLHFQAELWHPAQRPPAGESGEQGAFPYVTLNQSRTMRSGELHYLDHPEIGVLVRIDPVPVPTELAEALETWNRAEASG